jgi:hypothetical protein
MEPNMADICNVRHSSDLFTVYKDRQELATYRSDLEANTDGGIFAQVYDDACDEGFVIVSAKSGKEAVFAHEDSIVDGEGEILADVYIPTRDTVRRLPHLKGWKAVLLND